MYPHLDALCVPEGISQSEEAEKSFLRLNHIIEEQKLSGLAKNLLNHPKCRALLSHMFEYSPFLTRLLLRNPGSFFEWCQQGSDAYFSQLCKELRHRDYASVQSVMTDLRLAKAKASLIIALADLGRVWPLEMVTAAMTELADLCTQKALNFLLLQANAKNELKLPYPDDPARQCGLFVLALGKMGARELNYSSDIDLIVLFDRERANHIGIENPQQFFPKMTRELTRILQERTAEGYVFRVDLRLRPDPSSTPVALSTAGAITYYETVGQNWERAALIKARPAAGDTEAGLQFLKQITPFIWRKHLDFAAIADIQSIKRQMDARTSGGISLPGHNLKTGLGGIREIEFFAQIHQLIWGGRIIKLRLNNTCRTLEVLAEENIISEALSTRLKDHYRHYRTLEHRLQMIDDQQTHSIPQSATALTRFAAFAGFNSVAQLESDLIPRLEEVHTNFSSSFCGQGSLGTDGGTLSFTGVENNPQTLETIRNMGFKNAESISEVIQAWHRGARRATRTKRARELITELTPALLKAMAETTHPDQAFSNFDAFLSNLPAGIQLFSLFQANPQLLGHIALILGSAPAMAELLSKNPALLDAVLTANFFEAFPAKIELFNELSSLLLLTRSFEEEIDAVRHFKNERQFQAGVQLLYRKVSAFEVRHFLSDLADICIESLLHRVEMDYISKSSDIEVGGLCILALGRLGARDLTFGSDLDMVFVYKSNDTHNEQSAHYNKLSKRFINAMTALTPQGKLYEVDTRLRPSGKDGWLAVSVEAFDKYFHESAWTFEFMALTRVRAVAGAPALRNQLEGIISLHLQRKREISRLAHDVIDIRTRVDKEFGTQNPWNLKYVRGGLMDIDFLAQFFILKYAHEFPDIIHACSVDVFEAAQKHKLLEPELAQGLIEAGTFLNALFTLLRLCGGSALDEANAVPGLKAMIAGCMKMPHFGEVRVKLHKTLAFVHGAFKQFIESAV